MNLAHHIAVVLTTAAPNPQPSNATGQPADQHSTVGDIVASLGPVGMALVIGLAAFVLYVISLSLHPNAKCNRCKGMGRHRGTVFSYATRPCSSCKGRGTHPRLGRKVLFKQP